LKLRNETKVGLLAVVAITFLIFGYGIISGNRLFNTSDYYFAHYNRVNGLQESNPVTMKGFKIGEVEEIKILEPQKTGLLVKFSIKEDIDVPLGSVAQIYNSSLLGSKAIQLLMEDNNKRFHKPGDTLKGDNEQSLTESLSSELSPLKTKTVGFIEAMDTMVSTVNAIMEEGGKKDLQATLTDFRETI